MTDLYLAIVNPAAGEGRCGKMAPSVIEDLRRSGFSIEVATTRRAQEATEITRQAYARGVRNFLAVGGDGTAYEMVNGLFPEAGRSGRASLGFLPLGTGNSFLRDFTMQGLEYSLQAIRDGKRRSCDVIRLRHADGDVYYLNLLSLGFPADVGETTNRHFKHWGELGYILGVLTRLAGLKHSSFPHRLDEQSEWDRRPCLFLAFTNSKFTGGKMMISPNADPADGWIEYVRWSPLARLRLMGNFPRLFSGTHITHSLAFGARVKHVDFALPGPVSVMVDGEILHLRCESLDVLPGALDVMV